jgi:hypothetical protein
MGKKQTQTLRQALGFIGWTKTLSICNEDDYIGVFRLWKERTVAARRANNDEQAALLSQCKEVVKKYWTVKRNKKCIICGSAISSKATYCRICYFRKRYYSHSLPAETRASDKA